MHRTRYDARSASIQSITDHSQARYLRLIFDLLEAKDSTVVYEAASALTSLTSNPVAVKAVATKFIELSIKESDNNVKLIVLERVNQLRKSNEGVLDDLTMEILRVLTSPDLDVRRKALSIAMEMVSTKNVEEVIMLLKKELAKTVDEQYEKACSASIICHQIADTYRTTNTDQSSYNPYIKSPSNSLKSLPASSAS